jgi:hypothetical protein
MPAPLLILSWLLPRFTTINRMTGSSLTTSSRSSRWSKPIQKSFRTSDSWKFTFPAYTGDIARIVYFTVELNPELGKYQFSSFATQYTHLESYMYGYVPVINKAYENFIPSYPRKFQESPIGFIAIKESFVKKGEMQRKGMTIHTDDLGGGHLDDQGNHYDGLYIANNIPKTCVILPFGEFSFDPLSSPCVEYMEDCKLYWINDLTPHSSITVEEDCNRIFVAVNCGAYLKQYDRDTFRYLPIIRRKT